MIRKSIIDPAAEGRHTRYDEWDLVRHMQVLHDDIRAIQASQAEEAADIPGYVQQRYTGLTERLRAYYDVSLPYMEVLQRLTSLEAAGFAVWIPEDDRRLHCRLEGIHLVF